MKKFNLHFKRISKFYITRMMLRHLHTKEYIIHVKLYAWISRGGSTGEKLVFRPLSQPVLETRSSAEAFNRLQDLESNRYEDNRSSFVAFYCMKRRAHERDEYHNGPLLNKLTLHSRIVAKIADKALRAVVRWHLPRYRDRGQNASWVP